MRTTDRQRTERKARLERRIAMERAQFQLGPWQLAPSEVDDGPSPWPGGVGAESWAQAQRWRAEILVANPDYFDDAANAKLEP